MRISQQVHETVKSSKLFLGSVSSEENITLFNLLSYGNSTSRDLSFCPDTDALLLSPDYKEFLYSINYYSSLFSV